jgi:hypothetical protein
MEDRHISVRNLAASTGIPQRTLAERLAVRSPFTVAELQLIAGVLDTRASSLLNTPAGPARTAADGLDRGDINE